MKLSPLSTLLSTLIPGLLSPVCAVGAEKPPDTSIADPSFEYVPKEVECVGDQSVLVIRFYGHYDASESSWILEKEDEEGTLVEVESGNYEANDIQYVDTVCLEPDTKYIWTLLDSDGDGVCPFYYWLECNEYSAAVNGEVILEDVDFDDRIAVTFVTPSDSTGDPFVVESLSPSDSPSDSNIPSGSPSTEPSAAPSVSNNPSSAPTSCEGADILTVTILTDVFPEETSWVVRGINYDTGRRVTVAEQTFVYDDKETLFVRDVCLKPGKSYRWNLYDSNGDGFCVFGSCNGSYSVMLNGEEIVSNGFFEYEVLKEIGPVYCDIDEPGEQVVRARQGEKLRATCAFIEEALKRGFRDAAEVCAVPLADGSGTIGDRCKVVCAAEGQGPCA